jgi:hypothetical protein
MKTVAAASAEGWGFGGMGLVVVAGARVVGAEVGATDVVVVGMALGFWAELQAPATNAARIHNAARGDTHEMVRAGYAASPGKA